MPRTPLPPDLGRAFRVGDALARGASQGRLRGSDLARPFHGIRCAPEDLGSPDDAIEDRLRARGHAYAPRLRPGQFFSHTTAAALWGAPIPLASGDLHVGALPGASIPRARGIVGHRVAPSMAWAQTSPDGLPVASPATAWAQLGGLAIADLVAAGDFLCRVWRAGFGLPDPGRIPLTTPEKLRTAVRAGRRVGSPLLEEALGLIRLDSWSPRETATRLALLGGGLPEPALNQDVFDRSGRFLACIDLAYLEEMIAIEYQGRMHSATYARGIERLERLRSAGWIVIQVTADLIRSPEVLASRVRAALRSRGRQP